MLTPNQIPLPTTSYKCSFRTSRLSIKRYYSTHIENNENALIPVKPSYNISYKTQEKARKFTFTHTFTYMHTLMHGHERTHVLLLLNFGDPPDMYLYMYAYVFQIVDYRTDGV